MTVEMRWDGGEGEEHGRESMGTRATVCISCRDIVIGRRHIAAMKWWW
jgi:hypothetical protein